MRFLASGSFTDFWQPKTPYWETGRRRAFRYGGNTCLDCDVGRSASFLACSSVGYPSHRFFPADAPQKWRNSPAMSKTARAPSETSPPPAPAIFAFSSVFSPPGFGFAFHGRGTSTARAHARAGSASYPRGLDTGRDKGDCACAEFLFDALGVCGPSTAMGTRIRHLRRPAQASW
ncbi:hypothetical protein B0H19DRAFT_1069745 [Mycena capillaripes]|nr:hypothetical protein B0H19DRAFT_1069745 [Mycena capillaripes]